MSITSTLRRIWPISYFVSDSDRSADPAPLDSSENARVATSGVGFPRTLPVTRLHVNANPGSYEVTITSTKLAQVFLAPNTFVRITDDSGLVYFARRRLDSARDRISFSMCILPSGVYTITKEEV